MDIRNIENIELTDELMLSIFNSIDENENGEIDISELATFFANINMSPIDGRPLEPAILDQIYRGDFLNIPGFREYLANFDRDGDGNINLREFYVLYNSFHPNLKLALNEWFNWVMPTPAPQNIFNNGISRPVPARYPQSSRYDAPQQQQNVVRGSTEIVQGITFETLKDELREYKGRDLVRVIGAEAARNLNEENDAAACIEIHKTIRRMVHLNDAVNHLRIIAGKEMDVSPQIILERFQQNLLRGIDLYISYRFTPIYPRDGLVRLITHLMTNPNEGLQRNMIGFALNGNPQFSLSRLMFFINAYLDRLNNFGRSGEILFASYVMNYLQLAVGGYENTIQTFIENGGRPVGYNNYVTGCSAGNSDRVIIAMRGGIARGLQRIAVDPVLQSAATRPSPIPRQNSARSPRGQQNISRDELIATLIHDGMDIEEAEITAMTIMPPTPRQSPRVQTPDRRVQLSEQAQNIYIDEMISRFMSDGASFEEAQERAMSTDYNSVDFYSRTARIHRLMMAGYSDDVLVNISGFTREEVERARRTVPPVPPGYYFDPPANRLRRNPSAASLPPNPPAASLPPNPPAASRRATAINSLVAAGYEQEDAERAVAALPPTPPISRQNSIRQALPVPAPSAPGATFPLYIPGNRPNRQNQIKLLHYLDMYRTQEGVKTFENFKNYLVERSENDNEITDEPGVFLEKMATELYAPGSAYSDEDGPTFVDENDLEDNNADVWRLMPTEGGASKFRKTRRSKKKNTKKHRNLKKKGSRKMKRKTL